MSSDGSDLEFTTRFRAAPKGEERPTVNTLDWGHAPEQLGFESILAFSRISELRVVGLKSAKWKMLLSEKQPLQREIHAIKWHPNVALLAVGVANGSKGKINFLEYKDNRFTKVSSLPVEGIVSSLSWEMTMGKFLLATLSNLQTMLIVKFTVSRQTRQHIRMIKLDYDTEFTAEIHPINESILTAGSSSPVISVWKEDKTTFDWKVATTIDCSQGIRRMCFSIDGKHLAIMGGGLQVYSYKDKQNSLPCQPFLEPLSMDKDDEKKGRLKISVREHCESAISIDWSRNMLLTGSGRGTMCIHKLSKSALNLFYFRWSDVQSFNTSGDVTCVAWNPAIQNTLACGGVDGFVLLWTIVTAEKLTFKRSYTLEGSYFLPQGPNSSSAASVRDIDSVSSITSTSIMGSDNDLGDDFDDDNNDEKSFRKVLRSELETYSFKQKEKEEKHLGKIKKVVAQVQTEICELLSAQNALSQDEDLKKNMEDLEAGLISEIQNGVGEVAMFKEEVEKKLELIEEKVESVEEKLESVEEKLEAVDVKLVELKEEIKQQESVQKKLESVEEKLESVDVKLVELKEEIKQQESVQKKLESVEEKLESVDVKLVELKEEIKQQSMIEVKGFQDVVSKIQTGHAQLIKRYTMGEQRGVREDPRSSTDDGISLHVRGTGFQQEFLSLKIPGVVEEYDGKIQILEGEVSEMQLEEELKNMIDRYWNWKVKKIANNEFLAKFPKEDILEALSKSSLTGFPLYGIVAKVSRATPASALETGWIQIYNVPEIARTEAGVKVIGECAGDVIAIDKLSLVSKDPEDPVRLKINAKDLSKINGTLEVFIAKEPFNLKFLSESGITAKTK